MATDLLTPTADEATPSWSADILFANPEGFRTMGEWGRKADRDHRQQRAQGGGQQQRSSGGGVMGAVRKMAQWPKRTPEQRPQQQGGGSQPRQQPGWMSDESSWSVAQQEQPQAEGGGGGQQPQQVGGSGSGGSAADMHQLHMPSLWALISHGVGAMPPGQAAGGTPNAMIPRSAAGRANPLAQSGQQSSGGAAGRPSLPGGATPALPAPQWDMAAPQVAQAAQQPSRRSVEVLSAKADPARQPGLPQPAAGGPGLPAPAAAAAAAAQPQISGQRPPRAAGPVMPEGQQQVWAAAQQQAAAAAPQARTIGGTRPERSQFPTPMWAAAQQGASAAPSGNKMAAAAQQIGGERAAAASKAKQASPAAAGHHRDYFRELISQHESGKGVTPNGQWGERGVTADSLRQHLREAGFKRVQKADGRVVWRGKRESLGLDARAAGTPAARIKLGALLPRAAGQRAGSPGNTGRRDEDRLGMFNATGQDIWNLVGDALGIGPSPRRSRGMFGPKGRRATPAPENATATAGRGQYQKKTVSGR